MPNNYLYRCQGWCYSATFPGKIPIFQTLGGWGGAPRSVNGLNIYTFDLDCMFATVLYFPWVLHCFPRFSFVLIPFLTYVIILSWVCTAHFASRAMFLISHRTAKMLRNFAEKHGPRFWGENNLDCERSHDHCSHKKAGYYLSTIGGSKLALF